MNTIKFTNPNIYNIPKTIILNKNNKEIILQKVNKVKYYDKTSKQYSHLPIVYKIKGQLYV